MSKAYFFCFDKNRSIIDGVKIKNRTKYKICLIVGIIPMLNFIGLT
jgi:hypothetical protein